MKYLIFLLPLMLIACAPKVATNEPPLQYSMLPPYLDLDTVNGKTITDTNAVVDSSFHDFKSIPIDSIATAQASGGKLKLPDGVLISPRKSVLYVFYRSGWETTQKELKATRVLNKQYYDKSAAAEKLYQTEIVRLKKLSERSWLEQNMGYIGFAAGLAVCLINTYVLSHVAISK